MLYFVLFIIQRKAELIDLITSFNVDQSINENK